MATIRFRTLWMIEVRHAFHGGASDVLAFVVPASTALALAGVHAIAREREGRLHVLVETDEAGVPLAAALAGRRFVFGLRPREPGFELITAPLGVPPGEAALWNNRADADALGGPSGVRISGEQLRIEPRSPERPLNLRLFDAADVLRAQTVLNAGDEAWTPPGLFTHGAWRVEEQGAGAASGWALRVEPELREAWGLLELEVDAGHLAAGHTFVLDFAARSDTLRYYVVASRFSAAEFDQVQVVDAGFAAEGRPAIGFDRSLPAAFDLSHLDPALLDPSGGARIALFETSSPVTRRARGPTGLELRRNGDVLIGHLPQPGAERCDAQFVVHLTQS